MRFDRRQAPKCARIIRDLEPVPPVAHGGAAFERVFFAPTRGCPELDEFAQATATDPARWRALFAGRALLDVEMAAALTFYWDLDTGYALRMQDLFIAAEGLPC